MWNNTPVIRPQLSLDRVPLRSNRPRGVLAPAAEHEAAVHEAGRTPPREGAGLPRPAPAGRVVAIQREVRAVTRGSEHLVVHDGSRKPDAADEVTDCGVLGMALVLAQGCPVGEL